MDTASDDTSLGRGTSEVDFKEREFRLREQELALKRRELELREADQRFSRWLNPVFLGLVAATVTIGGNLAIARRQTAASIEQERLRGQSNLILEAIRTGDMGRASKNLEFFVRLGFIDDSNGRIIKYLTEGPNAPVLPVSRGAGLPDENSLFIVGASESQRFYASCREVAANQVKELDRIIEEVDRELRVVNVTNSRFPDSLRSMRPDGGIKTPQYGSRRTYQGETLSGSADCRETTVSD